MLFNRLFFVIIACVSIFATATIVHVATKKVYLYNAYAPGYDEYFILKSYQPLPLDTVTHFDDNAVSTSSKTGYTAKVLSIY